MSLEVVRDNRREGSMTICACVEWPEGLEPFGPGWDKVRRQVEALRPDILITNEMPFGPWLAGSDKFDPEAAQRSIALHEQGLEALASLGLQAVVSSRPVRTAEKLANEAFAIEGGQSRPLHRKRFFPQEPGWYEATWFEGDGRHFTTHEVAGLRIGILLCTDLMFNEEARRYGREGADLIAVPRAAGAAYHNWKTAGAMAAIVSGSYVVSSNRTVQTPGGPAFGGLGFAFAPDGTLLAETTRDMPAITIEVDREAARRQKQDYPCYVADRSVPRSSEPLAECPR